ncbi:SHOCT domain-containing protein [Haloplanus salilacus]|uniref:SHOCT domain-containing protein n=1 Tax=Haloplanus salilacus TaxID=2949994 RepID=UPI0030CFC9B4
MEFQTHAPIDALAQVQPGPHGPHPGPHWGGGPMSGGAMGGAGAVGGFGGWLALLFVGLLLAALVAALAYAWTRSADRGDDGAMATLRERYAAGDLDDEEFGRRREQLLDGD